MNFSPVSLRRSIANWLISLSQKVYNGKQIVLDRGKTTEAIENCGENIFNLGWRQGSFLPIESVALPEKFHSLKSSYSIIICSQSCSVVSPELNKDKYVELIVACPLTSKYNPRSPEAIGKNQRTLHLSAEGVSGVQVLEFSINSRFEIDRSELLRINPVADIRLSDGEAKKLTNWLARSYLRIALPNRLVPMLVKHFYPTLQSWLQKSVNGSPIHLAIENIYVSWEPEDEGDEYSLKFILVTKDQELQKDFDINFRPQIESLMSKNESGFIITIIECMLASEVNLDDIDGYSRLSVYDHFTSMGEWHSILGL